MKTIIAILSISTLLFSCKKEVIKTVEVVKKETVTVHDTIIQKVISESLIGLWTLYKLENKNGNSVLSSSKNYRFNFTSIELKQDMNNDSIFEYVYPVVYGSLSQIDVYYTANNPTTYKVVILSNGDYKLTRIISPTQSQSWYLRRES